MDDNQRVFYQQEVTKVAHQIKKSRGDRHLGKGDREQAARLIVARDGLNMHESQFLRDIMATEKAQPQPPLAFDGFSEIREELARLTALVEKAANAPAQPPAKPQFSGQYVTVVADQKRGYVVRGKHAPKSVIFDTEDLAFANLVASRIDNFVATRER
jgi:hypothetical protein